MTPEQIEAGAIAMRKTLVEPSRIPWDDLPIVLKERFLAAFKAGVDAANESIMDHAPS